MNIQGIHGNTGEYKKVWRNTGKYENQEQAKSKKRHEKIKHLTQMPMLLLELMALPVFSIQSAGISWEML